MVVMPTTPRTLIPHAPILQGHAADNIKLLQKLYRAEDSGPANVRQAFTKLLDREWAVDASDRIENSTPRGSQAVTGVFKPFS
tara:strand:+ start:328 stop:576 length:249 start_codon:yes stop_codon:yes gene_type:complete